MDKLFFFFFFFWGGGRGTDNAIIEDGNFSRAILSDYTTDKQLHINWHKICIKMFFNCKVVQVITLHTICPSNIINCRFENCLTLHTIQRYFGSVACFLVIFFFFAYVPMNFLDQLTLTNKSFL